MEGLKPMVAKAMDDAPQIRTCNECGKWIEAGNDGPVCGACAQYDDSVTPPQVTPDTTVGLMINGHNLNVSAWRTLQGLADDITASMTGEQVDMLVSLLRPDVQQHGPNMLPESFWEHVDRGEKIQAIKDLRMSSDLSLKSCKDIVIRLANKPDDSEPDDSGNDSPPDSDDGDGEPGESEPGGDGSGESEIEPASGAGEGESASGEPGAGQQSATAAALADLAQRSHANGKKHDEEEIRKALETLGIQF